MTLKLLWSKEVYIRLTGDETGMVATVKYGKLYSKQTEYPVEIPAWRPVNNRAPDEKRFYEHSED